jgi:hypothetical protein
MEQAGFLRPETELVILDEYLAALNLLFRPKSEADLVRLVQTFEGKLDVEGDSIRITPGATFRSVVISGEMQPAEWPKYRYLILELWPPGENRLRTIIERDRSLCRISLAGALLSRRIRAYCEEHAVPPDQLLPDGLEALTRKAKADLESFLLAATGRAAVLEDSIFDSVAPITTVES